MRPDIRVVDIPHPVERYAANVVEYQVLSGAKRRRELFGGIRKSAYHPVRSDFPDPSVVTVTDIHVTQRVGSNAPGPAELRRAAGAVHGTIASRRASQRAHHSVRSDLADRRALRV